MLPDIILFGIQGSGKGTQGRFLADTFGYNIFDTGSGLRAIAAEKSPLGEKVRSIVERGDLVPTEIVMEVINDFVHKLDPSIPIVFDGIPRNAEQQEQFDALMQKLGRKPLAVLISIPRDIAEKRLLGRKICPVCKKIFPIDYALPTCDCAAQAVLETRRDDNAEAIAKRISVFFEQTLPVIESYRTKGNVIEINGLPPISEVSQTLKTQLGFHDSH